MTNKSRGIPNRGLRNARMSRRWTQRDVAEQADIPDTSLVSDWERGVHVPNFEYQRKLCEIFGLSAEELGFIPPEETPLLDHPTSGSPASGEVCFDIEQAVNGQNAPEPSHHIPPFEERVIDLPQEPREAGQMGNTTSIEVKKTKPNGFLLGSPTISERSGKQIHTFQLQEQNRTRMLRKLRYAYETFLKNSLRGTVWIDLELVEKGGAVSNAANLLLRVANQNERLLPSGTSIVQAYEEAQQELLILGEPGVGKSTLLTELALHLITRAETDESYPLPVIVPLSTWAMKRSPLEIWLSEQISQIYNIPHNLSDQWMREEQFLPLLDGLDEMNEIARPACIAALNTYLRAYQGPMVVCSRSTEYETAASRQQLTLQNAVVVQPLTNEQVDASLAQLGESSSELRRALKESSALRELATMPLMLNLLLLTYHGMSIQRLPTEASELQQQVLKDYTEHMLARKGDSKSYSLERTHSFLSWLARQMREHNQTVFYLEHLQPTWLPSKRFGTIYERLAGKGISIFIGLLISLSLNAFLFGAESIANDVLFGLTGGLIGWLIYSEKKEKFSVTAIKQNLEHKWRFLVIAGARNGLLAGALIGLVFTLWPPEGSGGGFITGGSMFVCFFLLTLIIQAGKLPEDVSPSEPNRWTFLSISPALIKEHIELGLFIGLLLSVCIGVSAGVSMGVSSGLSYVVVGTFLSLILLGKDSSIELKEIVTLSVSKLVRRQHLLSTLYIFLLVFLLYGLGAELQHGLKDGLIYGLSGALSNSILYWTFIGLWIGVSPGTLDDQYRMKLNQGIRYSLQNALLIGLLASGISIFVGSFSDVLNYELRSVLDVGFSAGLQIGFIGGLHAISRDAVFFELFGALLPFLLTGGLAWLRHYLLRWLLYRAGMAPMRYKCFLDDARGRILLNQVGGGYHFIHRTILDYFAELDVKAPLSRPAYNLFGRNRHRSSHNHGDPAWEGI